MANDDLVGVVNGKVRLYLHPGQTQAWDSQRRFVFVVAGTQSGKTSFGPWWLQREITNCGPGDYLAVTATYDLFKLKMLPEMLRVFVTIMPGWTYQASDRVIASNSTVSREGAPTKALTRIILRSANAPGGLESATAQAAWLDECGQDEFRLESWEAVQRRLSLSRGRVLGTTTPYNLGWLKTQVYDRWRAGDPDFQVIQFKSTMNPRFPLEEYERARATLPQWKFLMFYDGEFSRPAGLIYDCFDSGKQSIPPFAVEDNWPRYGGLDFGGVHTAAVCLVEDPATRCLYATIEYLQGGKTAKDHALDLLPWHCRLWVGGSKSEGQWRQEFSAAGLPIQEPAISDVEVGINRVYGTIKSGGLYLFNTLTGTIDQMGTYSRELDPNGQPTEKIKNKDTYHFLDALRYIVGFIRTEAAPLPKSQPAQTSRWGVEQIEGSRWKV